MADLVSKAADFRDRVTIQFHDSEAQDQSTLEPITDDSAWKTGDETWADVQTLTGRDYVTVNQSGYVATHRVNMRYRQGMLIKRCRLLFGGVKLYVVHINNVNGRNARLELLCRSDSPAGL